MGGKGVLKNHTAEGENNSAAGKCIVHKIRKKEKGRGKE